MLVPIISAVYRRLPIRSGLTRLSFNPLMNRLLRDRTGPVMSSLRDGTPIEVDLADHDGRILFLFGSNDIKVSMTANAFLRPGDVLLDIGANYSTIGLAASKAVGPTGKVHLFEPQSRLAERVRNAIAASGRANVELHQLGLMDKDGSFTISAPSDHSGMASFVPNEGNGRFVAQEECQVREIGAYVGPLVAGKSFGVKLDVEGAEPHVMPWLLAQPNLRFLIFEASSNQRILHDLVRQSGRVLYGLNRDPLRLRITRIDRFEDLHAFHDLVAITLATPAAAPAVVDPRALARATLYATA